MKQVALLGGDVIDAPRPKTLTDDQPVEYTSRSAELSPCGTYRYRLTRAWGPGPSVLFVMYNPSAADAERDDPTLRRCVGFARAWGCGSLVLVNLFAYRATDPYAVDCAREDGKLIVGPDNDEYLDAELRTRHARFVAAWGANKSWGRDREAIALARRFGVRFEALRLTKGGAPAHPLYLPAGLEPVAFEVP